VKINLQSSGSQPNMSGPIRRLHLIYLPLCELLPELLPPELRGVLQSFELLQKRYAIKVKSSTGSIAPQLVHEFYRLAALQLENGLNHGAVNRGYGKRSELVGDLEKS
jgi:hypothetical protein